nr:HAMP domain-containing histidine kinase [Desulfobulbaceae bacterium]
MDRIIQLTDHLRALRWPSGVKFEPVDLLVVIDDAMSIMKKEMMLNNITLQKHIPDDIPPVSGKYYKLEQVFINLASNAISAIGQKDCGEITVTVISENDNVQIRFSDNGYGMSPETQSKIYEPFFTTKGHGKSAGIGMGIIYEILMEHHGEIICESELDKGTTFIITLPIDKCSS